MFLFSILLIPVTAFFVFHNVQSLRSYYASFRECVPYKYILHYKADAMKHHIDVTEQIPYDMTFIDPSKFSFADPLIEIRYRYNGKKYRIISPDPIQLPITISGPTMGPVLKSAFLIPKFKFVSVDEEEDVTNKVRKYYGPFNNYHGTSNFHHDWMFNNCDMNALLRLTFIHESTEIIPIHDEDSSSSESDE